MTNRIVPVLWQRPGVPDECSRNLLALRERSQTELLGKGHYMVAFKAAAMSELTSETDSKGSTTIGIALLSHCKVCGGKISLRHYLDPERAAQIGHLDSRLETQCSSEVLTIESIERFLLQHKQP